MDHGLGLHRDENQLPVLDLSGQGELSGELLGLTNKSFSRNALPAVARNAEGRRKSKSQDPQLARHWNLDFTGKGRTRQHFPAGGYQRPSVSAAAFVVRYRETRRNHLTNQQLA